MGNLEQQIRELGKDTFESFVNQYLLAKYPAAAIKQVDGSGGDGGLDSFSGLIGGAPTIWQCKHFPDRIKIPQQKQIKKSIKTAFKTSAPRQWTLCVPINLRTNEHNWFQQNIVLPYGGPKRITLIQASDFLEELHHNRILRDAFFPDNALSNMMALRKVVTLTDGKTQAQVVSLAKEYALQATEGLQELDPRLKAVYTFGGSNQMRQARPQQGLVLSISEGDNTTHLFARDLEAFNLDPLKFTMSMPQSYQEDFEEALDTGTKMTLPSGSIHNFSTDSKLLESLFGKFDPTLLQIEMVPGIPAQMARKQVPMRLSVGSGSASKTIPYVPFVVTQAGRRQITMKNVGSSPLEITVVFRFGADEGANVSLKPILVGAEMQALNRVIELIDELERSGTFELASLDPESTLINVSNGGVTSSVEIEPKVRVLIADASIVSKVFGKTLHLPQQWMIREGKDLSILKLIATGEEFFHTNINASLIKQSVYRDQVIAGLEHRDMCFRVDHQGGWKAFEVFGESINPGPVSFTADHAHFLDIEDIRRRYEAAQEGDAVSFTIACEGPCRWTRIEQWDPTAAVLRNGGVESSRGRQEIPRSS